jgi:hypothetical protein
VAKDTGLIEQYISMDAINVNLDPQAFDDRIISNGIRLKHFAAVPCPGSDTERGSIRSTHDEHKCLNGFHYKEVGKFIGVIQNNPVNKVVKPEGIVDSSVCYVIMPRFYENTQEQMHFAVWDRIEIANCCEPSMWVPYWETIQASQTGIDRARFLIEKIQYVIDAFGVEYQEGVDFKIVNGIIHWISPTRQPGFNLMAGQGVPYSIRYLYKPALYVNRCIHQIRILNTYNPANGEKQEVRYPYLVECLRETEMLSRAVSDQEDFVNENRMPGSGYNFSSPK